MELKSLLERASPAYLRLVSPHIGKIMSACHDECGFLSWHALVVYQIQYTLS